jgi:2-iminobutanoate/2-iminopropanoate deaminase
MKEEIHAVQTERAPQAIGPYSQAVAAGEFLFVSGQIPIDPKTGKITATTIQEQTSQVLDNVEAILAAEGLTFENVVKTDIFLKEMQEFAEMNAVYAARFSHPVKPARVTIQAAKLPMDARVEISCIAFRMRK